MKKTKWVLIAVGIVVIVACLAILLTMCGRKDPAADQGTEPGVTLGADTAYTVTVKTDDGKPAKGVGVYVYEDETKGELIWFDKTDDSGAMSFTAPLSNTMVAVLSDIPTGYAAEESYPITSQNTEIVLSVGVMTEEDMNNLTYQLGDKMLDFTVTDTDGKSHTLSELLKTKKAVILNFWYINCDPCGMEFPYMQEAYEGYGQDIEILAMNPVDRNESDIAAYKKEKGLTFPMAMVEEQWANMMQLTGYPTTVVVDRYGNISLIHKGMIESADTFRQVFEYFAADEYEPKAIGALEDIITESEVGTKENPLEAADATNIEITVKPGDTFYVNLYRQAEKFYLTVDGGDFTLKYMDKEYPSENGETTIYITPQGTFVPVELQIINTTNKIQTYHLRRSTPRGSYGNPYSLSLGEFTTKVSAGNDQGVYYTYWAEEDGNLTIKCLESTSGVDYDFTLYNLSSYAQRTLENDGAIDEEGYPYLSVPVKKGQKIQFVASTLPDSNNNYPSCAFKLLAQMNEGEEEEKYVLPLTDYTITVVDEADQPMSGVGMTFVGKFVHIPPVEETPEGEAPEPATEETEGETEEEKKEYPIDVNIVLTTGEDGIAKTQQVSGPYTVTIRIPEGYKLETTQYPLTPETPSVTVKLTKIVKKDYTVTVKYPDGTPAAGMYVTLGSEFKTTDDNGVVSFNLDEGQYSITISGVPEGYVLPGNAATFTFAEGENALVLTLVGVGGEENPYVAEKLPFTTKTLTAGEKIFINITAPIHYEDAPVLTIQDKDAVVTYQGKEYTADAATGILEIPLEKTEDAVVLAVSNAGTEAKSLKLEATYPLGTQWNPEKVESLDQMVLTTAEGDEDGYYYQYVNEHAGDLTLQVKTVTPEGAAYEITMTTEKSGTVQVTETAATVYMKLGEAALIHVKALPVETKPEEPSEPTDPSEPSEPTEPSEPSEPTEPSEPEPVEEYNTLTVGETSVAMVPDVIYNLVLDLGDAEMAGTLAWTGDAVVSVNGTQIASPYDLSNIFGKAQITATVAQETTVSFTITLPVEEPSSGLTLGENAIDTNYDGVTLAFTAAEDGTYVLSAADGEENAYVALEENTESVDLPYEFNLTAGQSLGFIICTNEGDDTVDLILTKTGAQTAAKAAVRAVVEEPVTIIPALTVELTGSFAIDESALPEGEQKYTVTVQRFDGTAIAGALVQIKQGDQVVYTGTTDAQGVVQTVMNVADYSVVVAVSGDTKYYYEQNTAKLTDGKTQLVVQMTSTLPTPSDVRDEETYIIGKAPDVQVGATYVSNMQTDIVNYFVFTPVEAGKYRITTSDPSAVISYWGGTAFPFERTSEYVTDGNYFEVNVYASTLGGADYVIGITGDQDAVLIITRLGDPDFRKEDLPDSTDWKNDYKPTADAVPSVSGKKITHINIKDSTFDTSRITVKDGFYYLDGKPLYINLNDDAPGFSLKVVMKGKDGESYGGSGLAKYFKDENGNWIRYENYSSCLDEYLEIVLKKQGGERYYPLTENLAHILQNYCAKWWEDPNSGDYQTFFDGANMDIVWLFCCCTIE